MSGFVRQMTGWWLRHLLLAAIAGAGTGLVVAWLFGLADGDAIKVWGVTW